MIQSALSTGQISTIIIGAILALLVIFTLFRMIVSRKKGKHITGCGDCSNCNASCSKKSSM